LEIENVPFEAHHPNTIIATKRSNKKPAASLIITMIIFLTLLNRGMLRIFTLTAVYCAGTLSLVLPDNTNSVNLLINNN
jgi:hypothetical protein